MLNKISHFSNQISPKKAIIGTMLAGTLIAGGLSSCKNKNDLFEKEKIEYVNSDKKNFSISTLNKKQNVASTGGLISNLEYISEKDSPLKSLGKRLGVGLIGGIIGSFAGVIRKNKSFLNKVSQCTVVGAAAGILFPGLTLTTVLTGLTTIAGGIGGTFFSGNEKIGKICAAICGIITAAACIF